MYKRLKTDDANKTSLINCPIFNYEIFENVFQFRVREINDKLIGIRQYFDKIEAFRAGKLYRGIFNSFQCDKAQREILLALVNVGF